MHVHVIVAPAPLLNGVLSMRCQAPQAHAMSCLRRECQGARVPGCRGVRVRVRACQSRCQRPRPHKRNHVTLLQRRVDELPMRASDWSLRRRRARPLAPAALFHLVSVTSTRRTSPVPPARLSSPWRLSLTTLQPCNSCHHVPAQQEPGPS